MVCLDSFELISFLLNMLDRRGSPIDMLAQSPPFDEIIVRLIMTHSWEFTNYHFQVIMEQKYLGQESFKNCMGCNFSEILTAVVSEVLSIKCNCCAFFSLQAESTPLIFKPSWHQTNSQSVWWQYLYLYFSIFVFVLCDIYIPRYLSSAAAALVPKHQIIPQIPHILKIT